MQHRILVLDDIMKTPRKKQTRKMNKRIRWWKLKKEYKASVTSKLDEIGLDLDWNKIQEILVSTAIEKFVSLEKEHMYNEKESLWGNKDTRRAITAKEEAFKAYQKDKSEEQYNCACKEANKDAKRPLAMANEEA